MQGLMAKAGGERTVDDVLRDARESWRRDYRQAALDLAWAAYDLAPGLAAAKTLLARLLEYYPDRLQSERTAAYLRLLTDRQVEPDLISNAGWRLLLRTHPVADDAGDAAIAAVVAEFDANALALTLLQESPVGFAPAERLLNRLRRWLLLSGRSRQHPALVAALQSQASLNGGAWPFDEAERTALAGPDGSPMIAAYLPVREARRDAVTAEVADPVTRAVKAQYEGWPYPAWTRMTVGKPTRLPERIAGMDPELGKRLPVEADMLITGCGTGRQAAGVALRYPDAKVTAIDVSEASLDYARRQCAKLGIANVRFIKLDLHDVADLGQRFHAVHSAGVLHHLPDPERGLKLLAGVLHPGGVMHIMVYNRYQRLLVIGARKFLIDDLLQQPVSDDLLRRVRQRFLALPEHPAASYVLRVRDFATLAGTYDLLLHRHEDPFDLARVERALDRAGLRLLSFDMASPAMEARYDAMHPGDPARRDFKSLARFESSEPAMLQRHYRFWCYRPRA
jgi:SAM-dependent methyltransferase